MELVWQIMLLVFIITFRTGYASSLSGHQYNMTNQPLYEPDLGEFAPYIENYLSKFYEYVNVSIVDCPDLTKKPFGLAGKGIGGRKVVAEVGGIPYQLPFPIQPLTEYSLVDLAQKMGFQTAHILGAGQAPTLVLRAFGEYMPNLLMTKNNQTSKTEMVYNSYLGLVNKDNNGYSVKPFDSDIMNLLATVSISENEPSKVLKVTVKRRTNEAGKSLTEAMQKAMAQNYPNSTVSLTGLVLIKSGSILVHLVPREFGTEPLDTSSKVEKWLRFFNASAPLVCMSTLYSNDPGLDLRLHHTHCISDHDEGTHYNQDISPDSIEYEGYFTFAQEVYRIDRPPANLPRVK